MPEEVEPQEEAPKEEAVEQQPEPTPVQPTPAPTPAAPVAPKTPHKKAEYGPDIEVLFVSSKGYGVKTNLKEFRLAHRGSKGTRAMFLNEKNGTLVGAMLVEEDDIITVISKKGQAALFGVDEIRYTGRGGAGCRVMTLDDDDEVVAIV